MSAQSNRLRLFGLIQELQKEAAELGLSRTAAALEVTTAVALEELSDVAPKSKTAGEVESARDADEMT